LRRAAALAEAVAQDLPHMQIEHLENHSSEIAHLQSQTSDDEKKSLLEHSATTRSSPADTCSGLSKTFTDLYFFFPVVLILSAFFHPSGAFYRFVILFFASFISFAGYFLYDNIGAMEEQIENVSLVTTSLISQR
jgi:hypothetical protein